MIDFDRVIEDRLVKIKETLIEKGQEYSSELDRFHNFRAAGRRSNTTPEQALMGMMAKHEVSVLDLVEWARTGNPTLSVKMIDQKIGDNINYLILLEGLLLERLDYGSN